MMHHADGNMQMQHSSTQTRHARRRHNEERRAHARRITLDHSGSRRITLDRCGGSRRDRGGSHVGIMVDYAQGSPSDRVWIMQLDPTAGSRIGARLDHGSQGVAGSRIAGRGWIMDRRARALDRGSQGAAGSWIIVDQGAAGSRMLHRGSRIMIMHWIADASRIADRIMHRGRGSCIVAADQASRIVDHASGSRIVQHRGSGSEIKEEAEPDLSGSPSEPGGSHRDRLEQRWISIGIGDLDLGSDLTW